MAVDKTVFLKEGYPQVAWLVLRSGRRAGKDWRLSGDTYIGRDVSNDIVVEDHTVSGRHARIKKEGNRFVLYDLGASNGTWLNGSRVQREILYHNDVIRLGRTEFVFVQVDPGAG